VRRNGTHLLIAIGRTFGRFRFRVARAVTLSQLHALILLRVTLATTGKIDACACAARITGPDFSPGRAGFPRTFAIAIVAARKHRAGTARAPTLAGAFTAFVTNTGIGRETTRPGT
jgi:hypothetical protein